MSVFNPRDWKLIVEAARDLMEGCRADDGSIDKAKLEAEIREHLLDNLKLADWYDLKVNALRFTIYEYVKWTIRNTRPSGSFKGEGEAGRRKVYQVPNRGKRGFTAKPCEALTDDDLEALKAYHDRTLQSRAAELAQSEGELFHRTERANTQAAEQAEQKERAA